MNKLTSFEDHLTKHRGSKGTDSRVKYDADSLAFRIEAMLQEERNETDKSSSKTDRTKKN